GGTLVDTLTAVLQRDPPWERLPAATPPPVRRLLERCLDKDPARRLRDIGDVPGELAAPDRITSRWRPALAGPWRAAAGVAAIALAAFLLWRGLPGFGSSPAAPAAVRSVAVLPLVDLSARSDEEYFVNGMTDEL